MNVKLTPWLFLLPAIIIYGIFGAYPIFQTFSISLTNQIGVGSPGDFVGLDNYVALMSDRYFLNSLKNTAIWVACFLIIPNTLAITIALLLNHTFHGSGLVKSVFFMPLALSFAIVGVIWGWIYEPDVGLLDQLLASLGLERFIVQWLSADAANYSVIAAAAWRQVAFATVIFLAGLSAIPQDLIDAARLDGCSELGILFRIILPLSKPVVVTVAILTFVANWNEVLWPLIVIRDQDLMTMPQMVALFAVGGGSDSSIGAQLASALLLALPVVIAYLIFQKHFIKSMASSGLKS